jgi:short-subunit dehydrogenase
MPPPAPRPLALVTGASSGIGRHLAEELARRGFDLVLGGRNETELERTAATVRGHGARATAVAGDLTRPADCVALAVAAGRPPDLVALNAGQAAGGDFAREVALPDALAVVDLDVRAVVHLAGLLLPAMVARGSGRVLVTASIAATTPGPGNAVYNAAKAFDLAFSLALREELRGTGVTVTALMPGPADTPIWRRARLATSLVGRAPKDDPARVAAMGVAATLDGRERVIAASAASKAVGRLGRILPDAAKARAHLVVARRR